MNKFLLATDHLTLSDAVSKNHVGKHTKGLDLNSCAALRKPLISQCGRT